MPPPHPTDPRRAPQPPWLAIVGSFVAGLAVNAVSDAYPGAAPTAVGLAVFFVAAVPLELRRRWNAQAPVHHVAAVTCAAAAFLALAAALLGSLLGPAPWTGWAVLIAATLGTAGCLIPAPGERTIERIGGVALLGVGVAVIGGGIAVLRDSNLLAGSAAIGFGLAVIGLGIAYLRDSNLLGGVALIGGGAAIVLGIAVLRDSNLLLGGAFIGTGLAMSGCGIAVLRDSDLLLGVPVIGFGLAAIVYGIVVSWKGTNLPNWFRFLTSAPPDDQPPSDAGKSA